MLRYVCTKILVFNFFDLQSIQFLQSPRDSRLLHRRVHLNDLPEYLVSGASNRLILHRTQSPSISSTSQYENNSGFYAIDRDETPRSHISVLEKRHYENNDELSYSNKRHVLTKRVVPVEHQRASVIHEQKPPVGKISFRLFDCYLTADSIGIITQTVSSTDRRSCKSLSQIS